MYKKVGKVMEIVVEQVLILTHAFNYWLVDYVLVFPLQLAFFICYYQTPSDYLNIFELVQLIDTCNLMTSQYGRSQMTKLYNRCLCPSFINLTRLYFFLAFPSNQMTCVFRCTFEQNQTKR